MSVNTSAADQRCPPASCADMVLNDVLLDEPSAGVWEITLNRPEALNALRTTMLAEITAILEAARDDESCKAVVLTGGEKVFAAGADINDLAAHTPTSVLDDPRARHWNAMKVFPKPIIAAVNGFALGGACELAMHCDIIIAGSKAQFAQPEVNLGIMPGAGGTQRLTWALGKSKSMLLNLTGAFMPAAEAEKAGLVAEVTEPELCIERARAIAKIIASKPPIAVRMIKDAVLKAHDLGLEGGLAYERRNFTSLFGTEDKQEGVSAFLEKRKPAFKGR